MRLKFETATDVVQNPPADAIGRVSNFIIEYRKVCATQVFSVAGICDDTNRSACGLRTVALVVQF